MKYLMQWWVALIIFLSPSVVCAGLNEANQSYKNKQYQAAIEQYLPIAKSGSAEAQTRLGVIYTLGQGVKTDYKEAFRWFEQAKTANHPEATYWYGIFLLNGYGVEKSPEKSLTWFEIAANQGYVEAKNVLGIMYMEGIGVKRDYATAFKWNTQAAKAGNPTAMYNLGQQYEKGAGTIQDDKQSIYWYSSSAQQGHMFAEFEMGYAYEYGIGGLIKDLNQAIDWYRKAANKRSAPAQYNLANIFIEQAVDLTGEAKKAKLHEGIALLKSATDLGSAKSAYQLSHFYFQGEGVEKDESYGLKLLTKAADQGYVHAQKELGLYRSKNNSKQMVMKDGRLLNHRTERDEHLVKALKHWQQAADQGDKQAITELAAAYHFGLGTPKDYSKATEYYLKLYKDSERMDYHTFRKMREIYRKGLSGDAQAMPAKNMMDQAAEGNPSLMRLVAQCHCTALNKEPKNEDENSAFLIWYKKAANQGDAIAKLVMAYLHAGKKQYEQTAKYYQEVVDAKDMDVAKYNLAILYLYGQGVEKSEAKAKALLMRINDKQEDNPQLLLARLYADGEAGIKDILKAKETYLQIANRQQYFSGNSDLIEASGRLASIFLSGLTGTPDYKQAYFWKVLQVELVEKESGLFMSVSLDDCFYLENTSLDRQPFEFVKTRETGVQKSELNIYRQKLSEEDIKHIDLEVKHWIDTHQAMNKKLKT